jgi:translation initiation factor 4G
LECSEHRVIFASKLLDIVEQKSSDVDVACEIITELYNQKLMQKEEYVAACKKFMEGYEDLILDVPQASKHVNTLFTAMGIDRSEVEPEEI